MYFSIKGVLVAFGVLAAAHASANIRRSCSAAYQIVPNHGGYEPITIGKFSARAGCGRFVPNRCRSRAKAKALDCIKKHWNGRFNDFTPTECTETSSVTNYQYTELLAELADQICGTYDTDSVRVQIKGISWGNTNCGGSLQLATNQLIVCN